MSKHTPGPWHRMGIKFGDRFCSTDIMYKQEERHIAICSMAENGDEVLTEANARLISAAPYLLEALQFYMAQFGQDLVFRGIPFDKGQTEADEKARNAIFKATGSRV